MAKKSTSGRRRPIATYARGAFAELLERRQFLSGVTLLTHGFQGLTTYPGWLDAMATQVRMAIASEHGTSVAAVPWYHIEVADLPFVASSIQHKDGVTGDNASTGEIVVTVDWSDVASLFQWSSTQVAQVLASGLTQSFGGIGLSTPLAAQPLHFIGHSRGASVVAGLAKQLGERGIWVEQVTTLDPHPVTGDYGNGLFDDLKPTSNVVFADNYWRQGQVLAPNGEEVPGAYDVELDDDVMEGMAYGNPFDQHSDVHLWYHGTLDTSGTISDGDISNFNPDNFAWYTNNGESQTTRQSIGYHFSRVMDGSRPSSGVSGLAGGSAQRRAVSLTTSSYWSNVGSIAISGGSGGVFHTGDSATVSYRYQDIDGGATVSFYLDNNTNPYDSPAATLTSESVTFSGPLPAAPVETLPFTWPGTGLGSDSYRLYAKITNTDGLTRYAYAPTPVEYAAPVGDTTKPTATLAFPTNGGPVSQATMNGSPRYINVTYSDPAGNLDPSSITDAGPEFTLGGTAAGGVTVSGAATLVSGTTYQYALSGDGFGLGYVTVNFTAGSWQDTAGNTNNASSPGFTVTANPTTPTITSVSPSTLVPLALPGTQLLTIDGSGFTSSSTVVFTDTFGVVYNRTPTFVNSTRLQYNIKVGTDQGAWTVKVVNSGVESVPATFYVTAASPVATPSISPSGGTYSTSVDVTLSTSTSGATLRYTLDGTDPTASSLLYSGAFALTSSATVKARGFKAGLPDSAVASATFTVTAAPTQVATPVISPNGGTFNPSVQVSISSSTPGATIIYTTNGDNPELYGVPYAGPFTLTQSSTVRAYAIKSGLQNSGFVNVGFQVYNETTPRLVVDRTDFPLGPNSAAVDVILRNGGGGSMSYNAYSWASEPWILVGFFGSSGTSTGPGDPKSFQVYADYNYTGATRVGHVTIQSGQTTQGAPLDITITQSAVPSVDASTSALFLTDSQFGTTPIASPEVGQTVYIRHATTWTGPQQKLVGSSNFSRPPARVKVLVDGVIFSDWAMTSGDVPGTDTGAGEPWTVTPGPHTITVLLDTNNTIPESNESNNQSSFLFTPPAPPAISVNSVTMTEGDSGSNDAVFTVLLSRSSALNTSVNFSTADGTATSGDYGAISGTLSFAPGETSKTVVVPVNGDTGIEANETFVLNLTSPSNATIGTGQGTGTIVSDDAPSGLLASPGSSYSISGLPGATVMSIASGVITLSSDLAVSFPETSVEVSAGASLVIASSQHFAGLSIPGGNVALSSGGNIALSVSGVTINGGGRLDLGDNALVVRYTGASPIGVWGASSYSGISGLIASGRNGGAWNGSGIVSSAAAGSGDYYTLGLGEASDLLGLTGSQTALWNGQAVDATTVLVKYTYGGDVNLSGNVDVDDYGQLDFNASTGGALGGYFNGDLNLDGIFDVDDYGIIDFVVGIQGPPL